MPSKRVGNSLTWSLVGIGFGLARLPGSCGQHLRRGELTTDRDAHDLSDPNDAKVEISAAHSFDSGVILGASAEYENTAFSDNANVKFEGIVGYRAELGDIFSVTGSAGLGRRSGKRVRGQFSILRPPHWCRYQSHGRRDLEHHYLQISGWLQLRRRFPHPSGRNRTFIRS